MPKILFDSPMDGGGARNEQRCNYLGQSLRLERAGILRGNQEGLTLCLSQKREEAVALQWSMLLRPVPQSGQGATSSHE